MIFIIAAIRYIETVALLSHKSADGFIGVKMEYEGGVDSLPERVTYSMIQAYGLKHPYKPAPYAIRW